MIDIELFWSCKCGDWAFYPSPKKLFVLRVLELLQWWFVARIVHRHRCMED